MSFRSLSREEAEAYVAAVRDAARVDAQRAGAKALCDAASARANVPLLMDAGAASVLATALQEWDDAQAKDSCGRAVRELGRWGNELQVVFAEAGVLEPLVAFLPHLDHRGYSLSGQALCCLTQDNPEVTQRLRDVPGVMEALEASSDRGSYALTLLDRLRPLSPSGRLVKPVRPAAAAAGAKSASAAVGDSDDGGSSDTSASAAAVASPTDERGGGGIGAGAAAAASTDGDEEEEEEGDVVVLTAKAEMLVAALRDAKDAEAQRAAARALAEENGGLIGGLVFHHAGAPRVVAKVLGAWGDREALENCLQLAGLMVIVGDAVEQKRRQAASADAGVLEALVALLPFRDSINCSPAAQALRWTTQDNPDVLQRLRDVPGVIDGLETAAASSNDGSPQALLKELRPLNPSGRRTKAAARASGGDDA